MWGERQPSWPTQRHPRKEMQGSKIQSQEDPVWVRAVSLPVLGDHRMVTVGTLRLMLRRFLSLEDSKNRVLCMQDATADETTTRPLESTPGQAGQATAYLGVMMHKVTHSFIRMPEVLFHPHLRQQFYLMASDCRKAQ